MCLICKVRQGAFAITTDFPPSLLE